jgi:hypothetical protein
MTTIVFKTPLPNLEQLKHEARKFFDRDPGNKEKEFYWERGVVNHLRHKCSDYDAYRYTIGVDKILEDEHPEISALKCKVLDLIERQYPELKSECLRQRDYLQGRLKAHETTRYKYQLGEHNRPIEVTDLIGADGETALSAASHLATCRESAAQKDAEIERLTMENVKLKHDLESLRALSLGGLYDELTQLRATAGEVEQYKSLLSDIRALTETIPVPAKTIPAHVTPKRNIRYCARGAVKNYSMGPCSHPIDRCAKTDRWLP